MYVLLKRACMQNRHSYLNPPDKTPMSSVVQCFRSFKKLCHYIVFYFVRFETSHFFVYVIRESLIYVRNHRRPRFPKRVYVIAQLLPSCTVKRINSWRRTKEVQNALGRFMIMSARYFCHSFSSKAVSGHVTFFSDPQK